MLVVLFVLAHELDELRVTIRFLGTVTVHGLV